MSNIKIENIRKVTLNGRAVKLFEAFELNNGAYVRIGQFQAPARIANKNLVDFI